MQANLALPPICGLAIVNTGEGQSEEKNSQFRITLGRFTISLLKAPLI